MAEYEQIEIANGNQVDALKKVIEKLEKEKLEMKLAIESLKQEMAKIGKQQKQMMASQTKISRQISKKFLIFKGRSIPCPRDDEDLQSILLSRILRKFGVRVPEEDIGQLGRLGVRVIIAEFLNVKPLSAFNSLIECDPSMNGDFDLSLKVRLTGEDKKILNAASKLKKKGKIDNIIVDAASGRIVIVKERVQLPINSIEEIEELM